MPAQILIIDDDPNIRDVIGYAVEAAGFSVQFAADGLEGLAQAMRHRYDLVVLDIGLPEMDGLEVCKALRQSSDVPILFLTARTDEIDRVLGMEIGGDDYVTKPFSPRELVARIKAILKRVSRTAPETTQMRRGALEVDFDRRHCRVDSQDVALTASEFSLLKALMRRPDHVISRGQLVDVVYGSNIHVSDRTIDSHIRNLRAKLAVAGCVNAVMTVHGVGLRMGPCNTA